MLVAASSVQPSLQGHDDLMKVCILEKKQKIPSLLVYYILMGITSLVQLCVPTDLSTSTVFVPNKPLTMHLLGTTIQSFKGRQG